jgi:hypothetical protein
VRARYGVGRGQMAWVVKRTRKDGGHSYKASWRDPSGRIRSLAESIVSDGGARLYVALGLPGTKENREQSPHHWLQGFFDLPLEQRYD